MNLETHQEVQEYIWHLPEGGDFVIQLHDGLKGWKFPSYWFAQSYEDARKRVADMGWEKDSRIVQILRYTPTNVPLIKAVRWPPSRD